MEQYVILGLSLVLGLVGFFLVKFYNSVEELKKGMNDILIYNAGREVNISDIKKDIHEIKLTHIDHDKRLREIEIKLAK
jgi:hypothetical protein